MEVQATFVYAQVSMYLPAKRGKKTRGLTGNFNILITKSTRITHCVFDTVFLPPGLAHSRSALLISPISFFIMMLLGL